MGLIRCVLIALRLGLINGSRNTEWARMCRTMLLYNILASCQLCLSLVFKGGVGLPTGHRQLAVCVAHPALNKGISDIPMAP